MKKIILTCLMMSAVSAVSFAQDAKPNQAPQPAQPSAAVRPGEPTVEQMAEGRAKSVKEQFKLSTEQYNKIFKIESDFFNQERAMRNSGKPPVPGQIQKMMNQKDEQYKGVMTPEQFAKYSATRPKPQPAPPAMAPAPPPAAAQSAAH